MSEGRLSRLLANLRLWARRDIVTAADGRILGGVIDPEIELLYRQVDELHDQLLDGHPLNRHQLNFIAHCQQLIDSCRGPLRQLELELA